MIEPTYDSALGSGVRRNTHYGFYVSIYSFILAKNLWSIIILVFRPSFVFL